MVVCKVAGREFDPGSIRKGFCRRSRVGPSHSSHSLEHTLQMLLPCQVVRLCLAVILDIKELSIPSFSHRSHSGAHITAA